MSRLALQQSYRVDTLLTFASEMRRVSCRVCGPITQPEGGKTRTGTSVARLQDQLSEPPSCATAHKGKKEGFSGSSRVGTQGKAV